jgi:hypothetical protein
MDASSGGCAGSGFIGTCSPKCVMVWTGIVEGSERGPDRPGSDGLAPGALLRQKLSEPACEVLN